MSDANKETFMGKMMSGLLEETVKRLAEAAWTEKFGELDKKLQGRVGYGSPVREELVTGMREILKDLMTSDPEVRDKLRDALKAEIDAALAPSVEGS